jgi:hypothetical protein
MAQNPTKKGEKHDDLAPFLLQDLTNCAEQFRGQEIEALREGDRERAGLMRQSVNVCEAQSSKSARDRDVAMRWGGMPKMGTKPPMCGFGQTRSSAAT